MKSILLTMMLGLLLIGCTQQPDLTFNEMVEKTEFSAKEINEAALFYESNAAKELYQVRSVFEGVKNTTIEVVCTSKGKVVTKVINEPFMEDEVIKLPVKLTLEDAEQLLLDAGYGKGVKGVADWSEVVLRRPLEPGFNFAQYIFTLHSKIHPWSDSVGFVSVDATTGKVTPVGLKGCPCPFKDPCICPEEITQTTFIPEFDVDYQKCGPNPIVSSGGVSFGTEGNPAAGRVCSKNGYKNISKIEVDIDLSGLQQNDGWSADYLNAAMYLVTSDVQPIGDKYCDAEYEQCDFCNEIDLLETNGNKMFQHTLHLDTIKKGKQRWEVSYTEAANTDCWNWDEMTSSTLGGVHSLVGKIDPTKPFHMVTVFNDDYTNMVITLSQGDSSVKVFDMTDSSVGDGSSLDMSMLKDGMEVGWWFTPSYHGDWSPGDDEPTKWYKDNGGECSHGTLCNYTKDSVEYKGGGWSFSNLVVTAESQL